MKKQCVMNPYAIPKCADVIGVATLSAFMAIIVGLLMMTCPKCEHVTFGKHKEMCCTNLLIAWLLYVYIRIQGYCIYDKKCPLLHPEREDDGYVPLSENTDNKNARYNSRIVCTIGWDVPEFLLAHMLSTVAVLWGRYGLQKDKKMLVLLAL